MAATSFESILKHTKTTHPIRGGTYRYIPEESNVALKRELEETHQKLDEMRAKYAQLQRTTQQPPAVATTTPELQKLQASLASMEKRATDAEAKTTRLEQSTQQLKASLASAETDRTEAEKRLNESVQKLASAEAARKKAEQRATDVEAGTTSKLKVFEADIMSMLDGISPRRMAAGGTFQEETILSVLGSTADHKESARVALEAMRETLRSVGKHEDLVKQWDETLATLENPKTTVVDHTTETPNAHYYEDIPTVVGLVPVVRRLLDRYTSARERRDTTEATLARAEFEASMLEATGIQYALDPMVWETKQ